MAPLIGYYAHHHGSGHRTRARLIAAAYPGPVHVLGTVERGTGPSDCDGADLVDVELPSDTGGSDPEDPCADGTLHWAPRHERALPERAAVIVDWVRSARPALVVVDVSVEVSLQLRLLGIPVVVVRQHGDRTDAAHRLAYSLATSLLAPYPAWAEDPTAPGSVRAATRYVGGFSRFDGRAATTTHRDPDEVVVMAGTGGTSLDPASIAALAAAGERRWTVLGAEGEDRPGLSFLGRVEDPWPHLCRAGVVVTSAGHSALCEAAAAGAPTVAVVESRPFAEQEHKVRVLTAAGALHRAPALDDPRAWDEVLRAATASPPRWQGFVEEGATEAAAEHLVGLATSLRPVSA